MTETVKQGKFDIDFEVKRTEPDYVVYKPDSLESAEAHNQHFIVFAGLDGSLMAIWTQHTFEGAGNHHIVFSRSDDDGHSWQEPVTIAGSSEREITKQASWAFPMVSKSGRIYVLYNKSTDKADYDHETDYNDGDLKFGWFYVTGLMEGIYSDDNGRSWSKPEVVEMPKTELDNPDPAMPANWIVWQKPERLSAGKYYVGFTRWVSPAVRTPKHNNSVHSEESVCEFMRFENIDDDPDVSDICVRYIASGEKALRVPYFDNPSMSCAQEPSIVKLPDGRLFAAMRTMAGCVWYSLSDDEGLSWCSPRPLLYQDHGKPVLHPLSCCPIYPLKDGRYILFIHNNDGRVEGLADPQFGQVSVNRRPVYAVYGQFDSSSEQGLVFSEPELFMDNRRGGDVNYSTLALYGSFTHYKGRDIFWYPDAKIFLLGREL